MLPAVMPSTLGSTPAREDERQNDRPVPQADRRRGHHVQEPVHLLARKSSCRTLGYLRPLQRVAGVGGDDLHSYKESVEAAEASDAVADRGRLRLLAGESGSVGPGEDVLRGDFVGRLTSASEEMVQHSRVRLDGAQRSSPRRLGRPPGSKIDRSVGRIEEIYRDRERDFKGRLTRIDVAVELGVGKSTLYRRLRDKGLQWPPPWSN